MRIIDAKWELKNLGVTTEEVEIDRNDGIEDIQSAIDQLEAKYQVVKVCSGRPDVHKLLSDNGFCFVESILKISHDLRDLTSNYLVDRISGDIWFMPMTADEKGIMRENIRGGMFNTDRISLDPHFTPEQAANRYINWIEDEITNGSTPFSYGYKDRAIGFCLLKEFRPNYYRSVIGGFYDDENSRIPLAGVAIMKLLIELKKMGAKGMYTYVSTNNPQMIRVHTQYGYYVDEITYVFVKHM